jgi:hypothetical protein
LIRFSIESFDFFDSVITCDEDLFYHRAGLFDGVAGMETPAGTGTSLPYDAAGIETRPT